MADSPFAPPHPERRNPRNADGTYTDVGGITPPVTLAHMNDTEGTFVREAAPLVPWWERPLKQLLAVAVIACGSTLPFLSPTEDRPGFVLCSVVVATGAGLGITSRGSPPK